MDLENLTKHQIVLLTLLVSFVTSIATGIVTVSLMNQAPPSVTRTINQIVEHTVQTIAPTTPNVAAVSTQKTVVVRDDDLVAQTISTAQKSIIRITARGSDELIARGIIITATGVAVTDRASLDISGATEFDAMLWNGARIPVQLALGKATSSPIQTITLQSTSTQFYPAPVSDPSKLKLGQSVIRISGKSIDSIGQGVVAMIPKSGDTIEASVESAVPGSVLMTVFGEIIGMTTQTTAQSSNTYTLLQSKIIETKSLLKT